MFSQKFTYGLIVAAATSLATASSAFAACAYVNTSVPLYLCNPHKAERQGDCRVVTRTASAKDLFYVLWLEGGLFNPQAMYYLKNVDFGREVGWIYANRVTLDPPCAFRAKAARRARKG